MAWIDTVSDEAAEGRLAKIYKRAIARAGGVANIIKVSSLNPPVLEAHMGLYNALMFGKSDLSRQQREMIATTVSWANSCHY